MKLGRVARNGLDGVEARLVAVDPERGLAIDLCAAERLRRERRGATPAAAARLAAALFPGSTTAAISAGEALLAGAAEALHAAGDDASLPLAGLSWMPAVDPQVLRDCLAFKEHLVNASARAGGLMNLAHYERPGFYKGSVARLIVLEAGEPGRGYTQTMTYKLEPEIVDK